MLSVGRFEMPSRAYLGHFNFKGGGPSKARMGEEGAKLKRIRYQPLRG